VLIPIFNLWLFTDLIEDTWWFFRSILCIFDMSKSTMLFVYWTMVGSTIIVRLFINLTVFSLNQFLICFWQRIVRHNFIIDEFLQKVTIILTLFI